MTLLRALPYLLLITLISCRQQPLLEESKNDTSLVFPAQDYGELFTAVQMESVFPDGKTFVDCVPKSSPAQIVEAFQAGQNNSDFNLNQFVQENFELPVDYASNFKADTSRSLEAHINTLWDYLTRTPDNQQKGGTLIALPHPYIVPGGRFGEIYYWDSYFTMLGLERSGRVDLVQSMVDNFAFLIDSIGFIPNGNRSYFLSRSQPPFFALMVELLASSKGESVITRYLPQLEKEYQFWMEGGNDLQKAGSAFKRVVKLDESTLLNRYWDNQAEPRAEMYKDDEETIEKSARPREEIFRNLRAACESGWDFSSRWLADGQNLESIITTELIPVDLNCLLYQLEKTLAKGYQLQKITDKSAFYKDQAQKRKAGIVKYCWDTNQVFYTDYNFVANTSSPRLSLAGMYPFFLNVADQEHSAPAFETLKNTFVKPGGVVSTAANTGQQWDAPNGWAPLQWVTIQGLKNYGETGLAQEITDDWIQLNRKVYKHTGKLVEKYNVEDLSLDAGGGEYPLQDGFGWTNGVLLRLLTDK